jgi:hypothetical protein
LVQRALDSRGWKVDAEPQGKEIEEIQFETFPVFLPEEKALTWANKLHWTTKEITLRKELLLEEGDLWRDELAQETGRNLRKSLMVIFSKLVPCLGTQPGKIKVLVVSRDFWSLRFGYDLTLVDGRLEYFYLAITEKNFRGVSEWGTPFLMELDQASLRLGQSFMNPRVRWTRFKLSEEAGPVIDLQRKKLEGGTGNLIFELPLFRIASKWGGGFELGVQRRVQRVFSAGQISRRSLNGESLPVQYRNNFIKGKAWITRSLGLAWKHNFTFTWRSQAPYYEFLGMDGETYSQESMDQFYRLVME